MSRVRLFKKALTDTVFNSASFTFLSPCPYLHLMLWIPSVRLLTRFDIKLAINLALSMNCNLRDIVFLISFPFSSILTTSFFIRTEKVMHFSVFSPKQVNFQYYKYCKFTIFFVFSMFIFKFFFTNITNFCNFIWFLQFIC